MRNAPRTGTGGVVQPSRAGPDEQPGGGGTDGGEKWCNLHQFRRQGEQGYFWCNLHRAELTALERDKLVAEWVELVGDKPGQVAQVCGGRGNKEGVSEASRQLGIERTDVQRALKVASLSPEAQDAAQVAMVEAVVLKPTMPVG